MGSQSWSSDSNTIMDMMEKEEMKEIFRIQEEVYKRGMATLDHYSAMAMEQRMEMYVLVLVAFCLFILFKILNVNNSPEKSMFYCSNQKFLEEFLKKAPELTEPYIPTRFWGYSGHLQTIIQGVLQCIYSLDPDRNNLETLLNITVEFYITQGVISRLHCPLVNGHRVSLKLTDGATVTYDLYHAIEAHPGSGDFTLCVCPGIGNNSESVYIRRVVYNAQLNGYRVCVLNHIGTLTTVPVTSARIFIYGNTADYAAMVKDVVRRFPATNIVCVGFSMGGNMITKYLGEPRIKPVNIVAGISVCQGYDANKAMGLMLEWKGFRRLYLYAMTEAMKSVIRRWQGILFTDEVKRKTGINERQVLNSATMNELDDLYTRRLAGFGNLSEFYNAMSCSNHLKNITVPTVFINARDDPIVPPPLLEIVRDAALNHENMIYIEQKFGGHLGFYEGGFVYSNPLTWQDRMVIHIAHALVASVDKKSAGYDDDVANVCDEYKTDTDTSDTEQLSWRKMKSSFKLERFNGGMTSDCSSASVVDSDIGTPAMTPPSTPVARSRSRNHPSGLNIFSH